MMLLAFLLLCFVSFQITGQRSIKQMTERGVHAMGSIGIYCQNIAVILH